MVVIEIFWGLAVLGLAQRRAGKALWPTRQLRYWWKVVTKTRQRVISEKFVGVRPPNANPELLLSNHLPGSWWMSGSAVGDTPEIR